MHFLRRWADFVSTEGQGKMRELMGKRINEILIDADEQHYLVFKTDQGDIAYFAEGDCCSESWFYHLLGVDALLGHTVLSVEEVWDGEDPPDEFSRQEVDRLYCVKLVTDSGYADIEFRNSSNGYYGGWLSMIDAAHDDEFVKTRFVPVTEDYIAQLTLA